MKNTSPSHVPFAQLPSEARVLFFIYASAAMARFGAHPPTPSDLSPQLEAIWNQHRLRREDVSDPDRMTALLKEHLAPVSDASTSNAAGRRTRCRDTR